MKIILIIINAIPVLLYYRIGDMQGATSAVIFSAHLNWLADNTYRCLSMTEFYRRLTLPASAADIGLEVLITINDGFADTERFNFNAAEVPGDLLRFPRINCDAIIFRRFSVVLQRLSVCASGQYPLVAYKRLCGGFGYRYNLIQK